MPIAIGILICLGSYFAGRAAARRLLSRPGMGVVSKEADGRYFAAPGTTRLLWRLAGPTAAYLVAVALSFWSVRADGVSTPTTRVTVSPDGPAAEAGIRSGDRVLAIAGVPTSTWPEVQAGVAAAGPGRPVSIAVERGGRELSFGATTNPAGRIGISPRNQRAPAPLIPALVEAAGRPFTAAIHLVRSTVELSIGARKEDLAGPVGIVREVSATGDQSDARRRFLLMLLAYPAALIWPLTLVVEALLAPRRPRPN